MARIPFKVRGIMNRYLALSFLLLFATFSCFFVDHHSQISINGKSSIFDYQSFNDSYPIDHGNEHIPINLDSLIFLILIILKLNRVKAFLISFIRRKILLTPVLYQSNYVISSPFK
jgi:hypothetical protein